MIHYKVKRRLWSGKVVLYQCPACSHPLESPLAEAGTEQTCPTCQQKIVTPGLKARIEDEEEDARQAEAERIEREKKEAEWQEEERQRVTLGSSSPTPETAWYGYMACHNCGYDWKSRRRTAPARCPACSSRNISQVMSPVGTHGCAVILALVLAFIVIVFFAASTRR